MCHQNFGKKSLNKSLINSIAFDENLNDIYFSTSTNGRIYRINLGTHYLYSIHHSVLMKQLILTDKHQHTFIFRVEMVVIHK